MKKRKKIKKEIFCVKVLATEFKDINNFIEKTIVEFNSIFHVDLKNIMIILVPSKQQFKKIIGREVFDWEIAITKQIIVYILESKFKILKKEEAFKLIKHELFHVYYHAFIPSGKPYWLNEGLAYCFAKQSFTKIKNKNKLLDALNYFDSFDENIYNYGASLVNFIIKQYGLNKLISFIKTIDGNINREEFNKYFIKHFKI